MIPTAAWYNATNGTFTTDSYGQLNANQIYYGRVIGADGSAAILSFNNTLSSAGTWNGTTARNVSGTVTASPTQSIKMAHAWDQNILTNSVSVGSAQLASGTYGGTWAFTNVYPGGSNYNPLNASVKRMTFFPARLSDAVLRDMTR